MKIDLSLSEIKLLDSLMHNCLNDSKEVLSDTIAEDIHGEFAEYIAMLERKLENKEALKLKLANAIIDNKEAGEKN